MRPMFILLSRKARRIGVPHLVQQLRACACDRNHRLARADRRAETALGRQFPMNSAPNRPPPEPIPPITPEPTPDDPKPSVPPTDDQQVPPPIKLPGQPGAPERVRARL